MASKPASRWFLFLVLGIIFSLAARAAERPFGASSAARPASALLSGSSYYTVRLCRLIDTRDAAGLRGGPVLVANATRNLLPSAFCGTSPTARSVSVNVTVTQPTSDGFLQLFPVGAPSTTSVINFRAGQTRANNAIVPLGAAGDFAVFGYLATGSVHVIVDVNGYFDDPANNQPPTATAGPNQTITLPASAVLTGTATDDGKPNPPGMLTFAWTKILGTGTVNFSAPTSLSTTASFSAPGIYVLRLTVSDSQLSASADVTIIVNPQTTANPQADIGRLLEQATWGPTPTTVDAAHRSGP